MVAIPALMGLHLLLTEVKPGIVRLVMMLIATLIAVVTEGLEVADPARGPPVSREEAVVTTTSQSFPVLVAEVPQVMPVMAAMAEAPMTPIGGILEALPPLAAAVAAAGAPDLIPEIQEVRAAALVSPLGRDLTELAAVNPLGTGMAFPAAPVPAGAVPVTVEGDCHAVTQASAAVPTEREEGGWCVSFGDPTTCFRALPIKLGRALNVYRSCKSAIAGHRITRPGASKP